MNGIHDHQHSTAPIVRTDGSPTSHDDDRNRTNNKCGDTIAAIDCSRATTTTPADHHRHRNDDDEMKSKKKDKKSKTDKKKNKKNKCDKKSDKNKKKSNTVDIAAAAVAKNRNLDENLNPTVDRNGEMIFTSIATGPIVGSVESECIRQRTRRQIVDRLTAHLDAQEYAFESLYRPLQQAASAGGKRSRRSQSSSQSSAAASSSPNSLASINKSSIDSIFGNLRALRDLYRKQTKAIRFAFMNATAEDEFEQALMDMFFGKMGSNLEYEIATFWRNQRTGAWYDRVSSLDAAATNDNNNRIAVTIDAHRRNADTRFSSLTVQQLLERISAQSTEYPPLLDLLLQETPLQSAAYQHIEKALIGARSIAKIICAPPCRTDFDSIRFGDNDDAHCRRKRGSIFTDFRHRLHTFMQRHFSRSS